MPEYLTRISSWDTGMLWNLPGIPRVWRRWCDGSTRLSPTPCAVYYNPLCYKVRRFSNPLPFLKPVAKLTTWLRHLSVSVFRLCFNGRKLYHLCGWPRTYVVFYERAGKVFEALFYYAQCHRDCPVTGLFASGGWCFWELSRRQRSSLKETHTLYLVKQSQVDF